MYDETFVDDNENHAQLQEFFTLSINAFPIKGLSFYTNGYINFEADEGFQSDAVDPWLNIIYIDWLDNEYRKNIRAGRQFIYLGVTNEIIDGVFGRYSITKGIGIGLYMGRTVDGAAGGFEGDNTAGTRLHYAMGRQKEVGLSYEVVSDDSEPSHENIGIDGNYTVSERLEFYGHAYYDLLAEDFYDLEIYSLYQPAQHLTIAIDYNQTVPSLLLDKTSIFWVFSVNKQHDIGIDMDYDLTRSTSLSAAVRYYNYDFDDSAVSFGAGCKFRYGEHRKNYIIGRVNRHDDKVSGYYDLQLLNRFNLNNRITLANDTLLVLLDEKTLDRDYSFSIGGDIRYALGKKLNLEFGIDYRSTPFYENELRSIFKLVYDFNFDTAREKD